MSNANAFFGGQRPVDVWDVTLTVAAAATTATATSQFKYKGYIEKIELDPGDMATSATLKGYEANTPLATETREHFCDYTFPASQVELVFHPRVNVATQNTGANLTVPVSEKYAVCDYLKLDLASAAAADSVRVRVYIRG